MPRNMSFFLTTEQIQNRTKTVTRRTGWNFLKEGDIINAVEKGQGLKKGEKTNRLCQIKILSISSEALNSITKDECIKEGFPDMSPEDFVCMFSLKSKIFDYTPVNRIEFEYL